MNFKIPSYVENILNKLTEKGHKAYIVGGCVRDILLNREPKDYDVATDATPDEILEIFKNFRTLEVGKQFGTVVVVQDSGIVEVTTFRADGEYRDGRRPEEVFFSKDLKEDVARRDFTINAMAYNEEEGLIDYFNGRKDLELKQIKTVGLPKERFKEDYLRIIRAIRFSTELEFKIEEETFENCKEYGQLVSKISMERIREEFFKILMSKKPSKGIRLLQETNILDIILPELTKGIGFDQHTPHHNKDVYEHTLCVVDGVEAILHLRLAALLHDIGKPSTLTIDEKGIGHFYGHDKVGAKMSKEILKRWRASNDIINRVEKLIYKHMTQHDDMKDRGLKRLIGYMGQDEIFTLFKLHRADRLCSNPSASLEDIIDKEKRVKDILSKKEVYEKKQLDIDGRDVIKLGYKEGKIVGEILDYLLEEVLINPELNKKEKLIEIIKGRFLESHPD